MLNYSSLMMYLVLVSVAFVLAFVNTITFFVAIFLLSIPIAIESHVMWLFSFIEAFATVVLYMTYTAFKDHVVIVLVITDVMVHIIATFSTGLFWFLFVAVFLSLCLTLSFCSDYPYGCFVPYL